MSESPWWTGRRGEWYVVVQLALFALLAVGPRSWHGWPPWPFPRTTLGTVSGWTLLAAGCLLLLSAIAKMGSQLTPLPYPAARGALRVTGMYAFVRHPMYCGGILAAFGWALVRQGWLTLGYALVLFFFFDIKARREEAWLEAKFPEYSSYRRRVRKLIPFIY